MCRRCQQLVGERGREVNQRDRVEIHMTDSGCCGWHSGEEGQVDRGGCVPLCTHHVIS